MPAHPAALPLMAIGIQAAVDTCARFVPNPRVVRAAVAGVVAVVVIGVLPQTHDTRRDFVRSRYRIGDEHAAGQAKFAAGPDEAGDRGGIVEADRCGQAALP